MTDTTACEGTWGWYSLNTKDVKGSGAFYGALFPEWTLIDKGGKVIEIAMDGVAVASMESVADEVPTHWLSYLVVSDCGATAEKVSSLGGSAKPIQTCGKRSYVLLQDNQNASFGAYSPLESGVEKLSEPKVGQFCWNEYLARDPQMAVDFYVPLVGWQTETHDMGPMGIYRVLKKGDLELGGIMPMPPDAASPSNWLPYVMVEDVDSRAAKAEALGGNICVPPTDIPDTGRFSVLNDPQGGTFAIFRSLK